MKYTAYINIMPREELLDPQGKATQQGLKSMGYGSVTHLRIGKRISMDIEAADKASAEKQVKEACEKLLVNPIMEQYAFEVKEN